MECKEYQVSYGGQPSAKRQCQVSYGSDEGQPNTKKQCCVSYGCDEDQPSAKGQCQREKQCRLHPAEIKQAILHSLNEPVVFYNYLRNKERDSGDGGGYGNRSGGSDESCTKGGEDGSSSGDYDGEDGRGCKGEGNAWQCLNWDMDEWTRIFGNQELTFRVGPRITNKQKLSKPQWEGECSKCRMTLKHFVDWTQSGTVTTSNSREIQSTTHWTYFDYHYMTDLDKTSLNSDITWDAFGFPERSLSDSTLWIGSKGANTPCHIDTYGCNLVVQVKGRKRWILFPPHQSKHLHPTRIPYEESSIYTPAAFPRASLCSHPSLAQTTPYIVTLHPGDTLYVPRHWWHSVENLDLAVSINTWIERPEDDAERVKEALVMYQVTSLCQGVTCIDLLRDVFNPNMLDLTTMSSASLLDLLMRKLITENKSNAENTDKSNARNTKINDKEKKSNAENTENSDMEKSNAGNTKHSDKDNENGSKWEDEEWLGNHGIARLRTISLKQCKDVILRLGEKEEEEDGRDLRMEEEEERLEQKVLRKEEEERVSRKEEGEKEERRVLREEEKSRQDTVMKDLINEDEGVLSTDLRSKEEFSTNLKLLIDTFTDSRVVDTILMVLEEKVELHRKEKL